jgi:hypothetical protein
VSGYAHAADWCRAWCPEGHDLPAFFRQSPTAIACAVSHAQRTARRKKSLMAVGCMPLLVHNTPVVPNMQQIPACSPGLGNMQLSDDFWMYEYKVCACLHRPMLQMPRL